MNKLRTYPKKAFWRLYIACFVLSLVLDFYWLYKHIFHYHFSFQYFPQFFALLGLFGCMLLILIAKGMGVFIVVDEDYYEKKQGGLH
jgi:hypothetical protein